MSPPDREHRFGHGKAEPLAALGQAAFIVFLLIEAGRRLFDPKPVANGDAGIIVMVFAIIATLALTRFQAYVVKRTDSLAIRSDALHYAGDLLANGGVIIALILSTRLGWTIADPLIAIAIAGFIIFSAVQIARGAFDMLMDRELPEADRRRILDIAGTHPEVMHDLRTRMSGPSLGRARFAHPHVGAEPVHPVAYRDGWLAQPLSGPCHRGYRRGGAAHGLPGR